MVVLAATICTKAGKILVSRQFTSITKFTLEEYIKSFPKLIQSSQQHTYVETDTARYIYLPIETMYLVLITYKSSNIIEDLETIRLLQKVIVDVCSHGTSETNIIKHAFDILLAFDDVIAFGYRESVTINQVQTYLSMESSEEKLHMMLLKAKQNEAAEAAKKHQREMMKKQPGTGGSKMPGFSSEGSTTVKAEKEVVINEKPLSEEVKLDSAANIKATSTSTKKGLQLGKPKKQETVTTAQAKKETATHHPTPQQAEIDRQIIEEEKQRVKEYNPLQAPVLVEVEEKIKCDMHRDGALNSFEVIGDVFITVRDPSKAMSGVAIEHESTNKAFKLSLHPSLNKQAWSQKNLLVSKEADQSFPIGAKVPTIKYRFASSNINDVPFNFTYWYSEDGSLTLEAEFNSSQDRIKSLSKLAFVISYPAYETPNVKVIENGDFEVDTKKSYLTWVITELSESNANANIEIQFSKKTKVDDLFPIRIDFSLPTPFYHIKSPGAVSLADQSRLVAEFVATLSAENWLIQ
mmetsp:Transcript_83565/g.97707  ORF Transcript_83565/g.97707 Transcript_83565/m.97707 type:complete len:521 (+) Transcript_83565:67-1629(+)